MSKLDELRNMINDAFSAAEDKNTIEKYGAIQSKMEELTNEQKQKDDDYMSLLKDYKEAVIHQSFNPERNDDMTGGFDPDTALQDAINKFIKK